LTSMKTIATRIVFGATLIAAVILALPHGQNSLKELRLAMDPENAAIGRSAVALVLGGEDAMVPEEERFVVRDDEFKNIDANGDGHVDRDEWISRYGSDSGFNDADMDNNGNVESQEWKAVPQLGSMYNQDHWKVHGCISAGPLKKGFRAHKSLDTIVIPLTSTNVAHQCLMECHNRGDSVLHKGICEWTSYDGDCQYAFGGDIKMVLSQYGYDHAQTVTCSDCTSSGTMMIGSDVSGTGADSQVATLQSTDDPAKCLTQCYSKGDILAQGGVCLLNIDKKTCNYHYGGGVIMTPTGPDNVYGEEVTCSGPS